MRKGTINFQVAIDFYRKLPIFEMGEGGSTISTPNGGKNQNDVAQILNIFSGLGRIKLFRTGSQDI